MLFKTFTRSSLQSLKFCSNLISSLASPIDESRCVTTTVCLRCLATESTSSSFTRRSRSRRTPMAIAASPRRSIAATARPVGFYPTANRSAASTSSFVVPRHFSSVAVETPAKKVEDVMPIATGHEKEELEAELEGRKMLDINFPEGPFGTKGEEMMCCFTNRYR